MAPRPNQRPGLQACLHEEISRSATVPQRSRRESLRRLLSERGYSSWWVSQRSGSTWTSGTFSLIAASGWRTRGSSTPTTNTGRRSRSSFGGQSSTWWACATIGFTALPLILAHLATVYLLWRFMLRHQVEVWTATLLAIAFAVVGVGSQNLTYAFQLTFVGSVAFGMLAIDAIETDRTWLAPLWCVCSLMCSDLGIPMIVACGFVRVGAAKVSGSCDCCHSPNVGLSVLVCHHRASRNCV